MRIKIEKRDGFSIDDMLSMICENNGISSLNFVIYEHIPLRSYEKINPEDGIKEHIEIETQKLPEGLRELRGYAASRDLLVGVTSKVMVNKVSREMQKHLAFLDFDSTWCPVCSESYEEVRDFVQESHLVPGFVAASGRSYHFYYDGVMEERPWREMLEGGSQLVDEEWASLQSQRGYSVLRVSTNSKKKRMPTVVEAMGYQPVNLAQLYLFDEYKPKWPLERILPRSYLL